MDISSDVVPCSCMVALQLRTKAAQQAELLVLRGCVALSAAVYKLRASIHRFSAVALFHAPLLTCARQGSENSKIKTQSSTRIWDSLCLLVLRCHADLKKSFFSQTRYCPPTRPLIHHGRKDHVRKDHFVGGIQCHLESSTRGVPCEHQFQPYKRDQIAQLARHR